MYSANLPDFVVESPLINNFKYDDYTTKVSSCIFLQSKAVPCDHPLVTISPRINAIFLAIRGRLILLGRYVTLRFNDFFPSFFAAGSLSCLPLCFFL